MFSSKNPTRFLIIFRFKKKKKQVFFFKMKKINCQHILVQKFYNPTNSQKIYQVFHKCFFKQFFRFKIFLKSTNCNENPILSQIFIKHWDLVSFFYTDIRFSSSVNERHSIDNPFYNLHLTDIQDKIVILHQGHDHNFNSYIFRSVIQKKN